MFEFYSASTLIIKASHVRLYKSQGLQSKRQETLDIFSEAERKIHALADFLAQCQLNNFRGVYVFDDPVNSLDEDILQNVYVIGLSTYLLKIIRLLYLLIIWYF